MDEIIKEEKGRKGDTEWDGQRNKNGPLRSNNMSQDEGNL